MTTLASFESHALPSRSEVEARLRDLIVGRARREDVAAWASLVIAREPVGNDPLIWCTIDAMSGADAPSTDRRYLFVEADFCVWLARLRAG